MTSPATGAARGGSDPGLARLVDGVLLPGFTGTTVPDWLAERLAGGLAGVFLFGHNIDTPEQTVALTGAVHAASSYALVASDEEGGDVTRIEQQTGSSWPGAAALGRFDDPTVTERLARAAGMQAHSAGVDLVAAPVADVHSDPDNPVIGIRSFGADPGLVSRHVAASVRGFQEAGVAACAKHWPGHGSTYQDSHLTLPVVADDELTIRVRDLPPFVAAVEAGVRSVMTAHIRFPAVDQHPATLSGTWMRLLRDELGFDGVVVSDALDMAAVAQGVGRGEGGVLALLAGVDLLCLGSPAHPRQYDDQLGLAEVYDAVLTAAMDGRLPRARLEQAAYRVRELGADLAARRRVTAGQTDPGAQVLARDVLLAVVEVHGRARLADGDPVVVDLRTGANIAAGQAAPRLSAALRARRPGTTDAVVADGDVAAVAGLDPPDRPVVAIVDAPHRHAGERESLAVLLAARPDTVVVQTGLGDDQPLPADRWVRAWGGGRAHAEVVADLLLGPAGAP